MLESGQRETDLTGFISRHAGLFFHSPETHFVLSELKLGADFAVDLVVPKDQGSVGIEYGFIEIERPDAPAFTKSGDPSARLSHAFRQIADWKTWLKRHQADARELFPAPAQFGPNLDAAFTYTVVIGRRSDSPHRLANRNSFGEMAGVTIRSFDWLIDRLRSSAPLPPGPITPSAEAEALPFHLAQALKNPFLSSISDAHWRTLRAQLVRHPHLVAKNAVLFANARQAHPGSLARFRDFCSTASTDVEQEIELDNALYEHIVQSRRAIP